MESHASEIVNIEEIMQEIRQLVLAKKDLARPDKMPFVKVTGRRLSPAFYEHLYQTSLIYNEMGVKLHVTKVNVPLIGPLLEKARTKFHELALYYVNQLAAEQIQFNTHILQAVSLLAQELEEEESE